MPTIGILINYTLKRLHKKGRPTIRDNFALIVGRPFIHQTSFID